MYIRYLFWLKVSKFWLIVAKYVAHWHKIWFFAIKRSVIANTRAIAASAMTDADKKRCLESLKETILH